MKQEQPTRMRNDYTNSKAMTDEEVCRAIIALANLCYIKNGCHDIRFRKEQK